MSELFISLALAMIGGLLMSRVAKKLNLPVKFISGTPQNLDGAGVPEDKKFPLKLFMQLPFDANA